MDNCIQNQIADKNELPLILNQLSDAISDSELSEAARLAYKGDYSDAEERLIKLAKSKPNHNVFDLMARLRAQQGDLLQAEVFWRQALEYKPNCEECLKALSKIHELRAKKILSKSFLPKGAGKWIVTVIYSICLIMLIIYTTVFLKQIQSTKNTVLGVSTAISEVSDIYIPLDTPDNHVLVAAIETNNQVVNNLSTQIAQASAEQPSNSGVVETETPKLEFIVQIDGITLNRTSDSTEIIFNHGLFQYETLFTPEGKKLLLELGTRLKPYINKIRVEVVGFIDITEAGRNDLELSRASAVVNFLENNIPLPETMFYISQPGDRSAPFDNNSLEGKTQNRTVVIIIHYQ